MYKLKRSKRTLRGQQGKVCDSCEKLGRETRDNLGNNKRDFRADVLSLLSSALRPRLLGTMGVLVMILMGFNNFSQVSAVSLTLTVPEGLSINISPNGEGVYKKSETGTISVQSDAFAGFTLDIKSKTDNNLSNGSAHIESITAETTEEEFRNTGKNNTWGFLPSRLNGIDNTKLQAGPTSAPIVIERTKEKTEGAKDYEIAFATKVDSTLPTGNYTNTFVISSVANTVSYSIQYDANQGTGGPSENPQTGNTAEEAILLDSAKPTRGDSYEFVGWCTVQTSNEKCEGGDTYQPGGEFKLAKSNNTVILYAMWKGKFLSMQSWTGCSSLLQHQTITLKDDRDNKTYTVAKLKDGECWMTQNLRYDAGYLYKGSETYGNYYTAQEAQNKCPNNWRLLSGSEDYTINTFYDSQTAMASPANFVRAGYWYGGTIQQQGSFGYWWTSDGWNGVGTYFFILDSSRFGSYCWSFYNCHNGMLIQPNYGASVRCIFNG